ncbi:MAG: choice-of-anchor J domain-containing protein [Reichenbachiella sp.]
MNKLILTLFFFIFYFSGFSQRKCATDIFNTEIIKNESLIQNPEKFEQWLEKKKNNNGLLSTQMKTTGVVYTIPVVFHVIHFGEEIGEGANISDEKIMDQILTLNNDYRRLNEDASNTPSDFIPVAADTEISFVLARQDPEGLPTNGIVRTFGNRPNYDLNELVELPDISSWPTDQYLNIWISEFANPDYLGVAQYPVSSLEGLEVLFDYNSKTDGVFINYPYIGNGIVEFSNGSSYESLGRTVTHEVGHWLGLRHIWGDGGCSIDDYCDDTPTQEVETYGCHSHGSVTSCSGDPAMFQNYMDYTDDVCVNIFTQCQSGRMRTVMDFSPRRNQLINSPGLQTPLMVENDLGIRQIHNPDFGNCSSNLEPTIEVRNYGTNAITSFEIQLLIDDLPFETLSINSNLDLHETHVVTFGALDLSLSNNVFTFKVLEVNGVTDVNETNNCRWISSFFPKNQTIPLFEDFESSDSEIQNTWSLINMDQPHHWSFEDAPNISIDNKALTLNCYNSSVEDQLGANFLLSPVFNLIGVVTVDLYFKYAYSKRPEYNTDALLVLVSTDCGESFLPENVVLERRGQQLNTTSQSKDNFVPEGSGDWRNIELNIGEYANQENVVIAIAGINGGGNNIYIDDIEISTSNVNEFDISITEISNLPAASCREFISPLIHIQNLGLQTITSFRMGSTIDGKIKEDVISNLSIEPGKTSQIPISFSDLSEGEHLLEIVISRPNDMIDEDLTNNFLESRTKVSFENEAIPLRETFTNSFSYNRWDLIRQDAETNWELYVNDSNSEKHIYVNGHNLEELNIQNWLVSPQLDLSGLDSASLQFDVSYGFKEGRNDRLQVLASRNCGTTYTDVLYDKSGSDLAVRNHHTEWVPSSNDDWRTETIDLSQLVDENLVKLAFVHTNQNGNNLFLDNIEFFDVGTPPDVEVQTTMSVFPNPAINAFQVIFNFNIKETVLIQLVSLSGEVIIAKEFPNTLNQIYEFNNLNIRSGLYFVRAKGRNTDLTRKILFSN